MVTGNVDRAVALLRAVATGDPVGATRDVSPRGFVPHDPAMADGVAGLREMAARPAGDGGRLEVARILEDGALVVVHGRNGAEAFFAVFRFEGDLIAEGWRFAAPVARPNASGHTQTDGPTEPDGRVDSGRSKAIVRDNYETVHVAGRHDRVRDYMSGERQIRHEPGVHDGVEAFERDLAVLTRMRTIDEIVLLAGQGDLVFVAARGTHEGEPCAYVDLYRVEAGKLVEHWGFPQAIPSRAASSNANGML